MKMSEFTTKSFLGNAGAAENSYILINYEDNTTQRPVTYKASLQEIGKAIANDQKLYKKTQNGAITTTTENGAYVNTAAENFASTGAVVAAVQGLASTGYITNALSGYVHQGLDSNQNPVLYYNTTRVTPGLIGAASTGAVTAAVSGLASTGYVDAAVENAGGGGFSNPGDMPVYANSSTGEIRWYNADDPSDSSPYPVTQTHGLPLVVYDSTNGVGYFMTPSASEITPLNLGGAADLTNYVYVTTSQDGSQSLDYADGTDTYSITPSTIGALEANDRTVLHYTTTNNGQTIFVDYSETQLFNELVSIDDLVNHLYYDVGQSTVLIKNANGTTTDFGAFASRAYIEGHYASTGALAAKASTGAVTAAVNGLASTGYVTSAINTATSGLASTGYVTNVLNTAIGNVTASEIACLGTSDDKICIRDCQGNFQGFLSAT